MTKLKRINLNINEEIIDRVDKDAEEMGLTRTALITLMINQYYKGVDTIALLSKLAPILEQHGGVMNGQREE